MMCLLCLPGVLISNQIALPKIHENDVLPDQLLLVSLFNAVTLTPLLIAQLFCFVTDSYAFLISAPHGFRPSLLFVLGGDQAVMTILA
jgi:hypothetical protein